jgi:hypothetical protein
LGPHHCGRYQEKCANGKTVNQSKKFFHKEARLPTWDRMILNYPTLRLFSFEYNINHKFNEDVTFFEFIICITAIIFGQLLEY